ncbi:hypothetical protein WOC76_01690 [Methylocystis sp. IM3]|uniref:hypothetical protein n=1 Tax=unclassified Methylocystis TaxID=2625913 RepID=UPI0030F4F21E
MEVAAVSLFLIASVGAFLAVVAALVVLRPQRERAAISPDAMKQFVILASVLSLVCIVLYIIAEYTTIEKSASNGSMIRQSGFVRATIALASASPI